MRRTPTKWRNIELGVPSTSSCGQHQELDLGGEVVNRLIPLDHRQPDRHVVAQQGFGCARQGLRHHGEELGDPHLR